MAAEEIKLKPLPGSAGFPIVGDMSVAFYRDPISFVSKKIEEYQSKIFLSRFLNKPTVFVASYSLVSELLNEKSDNCEMGYKQFMHSIYGDNILFANGLEAVELREMLRLLLSSSDTRQNLDIAINSVMEQHLTELDGNTIATYKFFKRIATEICLSFFLGVDPQVNIDLAETITSLSTTHWHGIISVPLKVNLPAVSKKSTYAKALDAKMQLLELIKERLQQDGASRGSVCQDMKKQFSEDTPTTINHVLLFTSALVPKALASLLTSFVIALANRKPLMKEAAINTSALKNILLEVIRMWPPFIGGRRMAIKSFSLGGYKIHPGQSIVYMSHHANRDANAFFEPDEFYPKRHEQQAEPPLTFSCGSRCCVGDHLVQQILEMIGSRLVKEYTWDIVESESLSYKWLPVARPQSDTKVSFCKVSD